MTSSFDRGASPQIQAKEGKSAYQRGELLDAARYFEAARQGFGAAGDWLSAAEMANNASVAYLQAEQAESALKAVEGTIEVFAQAGDLRRQGMALGNQAAALEELDRTEEAIAAYQKSAEILDQAGEDQLRANVMQSLSMLQFREGRQLQALASMQAGLEGVQRPSPKQMFLKKLLHIPFEMMGRPTPPKS
jgi:tetratricopeptide (TPR) repeat protein